MNMEISMASLKHIFSFPFQDPRWKAKFLTGSLLALGGFIVPIISWLPLFGYMARMIRAGARNADPAALPEWDDWGDLFMDGLRLLGASLILMLPVIAVFGFGWVVYLLSVFSLQNNQLYARNAQQLVGFFAGMFVFLLSLGIGTLLSMLTGLVMTPAETHVAYQRRFTALFEVGAWWKIFRANLDGFLVTLFIMLGLTMVMMYATQLLYMTIILCMVIPLIYAPLYFYTIIIFGRLAGQAYGEGLASTTLQGQPA